MKSENALSQARSIVNLFRSYSMARKSQNLLCPGSYTRIRSQTAGLIMLVGTKKGSILPQVTGNKLLNGLSDIDAASVAVIHQNGKDQEAFLVCNEIPAQGNDPGERARLCINTTAVLLIITAQGSQASCGQQPLHSLQSEFIFHLIEQPYHVFRSKEVEPAQSASVHPPGSLWKAFQIRAQECVDYFFIVH